MIIVASLLMFTRLVWLLWVDLGGGVKIEWITQWKGRDQDVLEFTNIFHTLHMKLGIKDFEWHMVLKFHDCVNKYI